MNTKLSQIYILSKPGIFCIKNEETKTAFISHSSCILKTLGNIFYKPELDLALGGIHNCDIELLQEVDKQSTRLMLLPSYKLKLEQLGYKLVGSSPKGTRYKLKLRLYEDFRDPKASPLAFVELDSQKASTVVIGVFPTLKEAREWIIATYNVLEPVYPLPRFCTNELTMLYLSNTIKN